MFVNKDMVNFIEKCMWGKRFAKKFYKSKDGTIEIDYLSYIYFDPANFSISGSDGFKFFKISLNKYSLGHEAEEVKVGFKLVGKVAVAFNKIRYLQDRGGITMEKDCAKIIGGSEPWDYILTDDIIINPTFDLLGQYKQIKEKVQESLFEGTEKTIKQGTSKHIKEFEMGLQFLTGAVKDVTKDFIVVENHNEGVWQVEALCKLPETR